MLELKTTARLVGHETLEESLTTTFARDELETAVENGDGAQLWFELGLDEDEPRRLTIDLAPAEIAEILRLSDGDDVALALDGAGIARFFEEPEVEAHGFRGALAVAVTTAAVLAPTSLAAVPQAAETATTAQRVGTAATAQVSPAATAQVSSMVAPARAARSLVGKPQVTKSLAAKPQVTKSLVLKAQGLTLMKRGLAR